MKFVERLASMNWSRVIAGSIFIAAIYYFTVYDSGAVLDTRVHQAEKQLADSNDKLAKTREADKNVRKFVQKVDEAEQQFKDVTEYMPSEINLGNFLQKVKDQASSVGATVQGFSPSSDVQKKDFYEIRKFDLQIVGSFSQIVSFLSNLTKMPLLVTFDKISMTTLDGEFDTPRLTFKGVLLGYRYLKDSQTPAAAAPGTATGGK